MSNGGYEVVLRGQQAELVPAVPVDLAQWAEAMQAAGHIAKALAPTAFIPRSLRVYYRPDDSNRDEVDVPGTTAAVAAAVLTGKEVGLSPMAALRSIDIIDGTPALRAVALRAIVLRAGHQLWVDESTQTRAIVKGIRAGTNREQTSTWTLDRAKTAGLTGKKNWQAHPGAMLVARATAEVARLIAPDVLLGLPYAAEELVDGDVTDEPEQQQESAPTPKRRTAQRKPRKAAAPVVVDVHLPDDDEPGFDDDPVPDSPVRVEGSPAAGDIQPDEPAEEAELVVDQADAYDDDAQPDPVTTEQLAKMRTQFLRLEIKSAPQRLAYVLGLIDRDITTAAEMTMVEATEVLRQLDADVTAREEFDQPLPDEPEF